MILNVKLVSQIRLAPTQNQHRVLEATIRRVNTACNYVSDVAWRTRVFRQFDLHREVYVECRNRFELTAQAAVLAIGKVSDAYKLNKLTKRKFRPLGAIAYDSRILSFKLDAQTVSIWTAEGRQAIPFTTGKRQMALLQGKRGQADLCLVDGRFYLFVSCEVETPDPTDVSDFLGIDCGIVNLAVDSDGQHFSGGKTEERRRIYAHRRRNLQRKGTRSAKRKLKFIRRKQSRFQGDTNHCISKAIVVKAERTGRGIALEKLTNIRARVRATRRQRGRLHNWGFGQLQAFVAYKAKRQGVRVVQVDPRNTSRECPACGDISKKNRPTQSVFNCGSCGLSGSADHIAARNIRARAVVNLPMVANVA